MLTKNLLVRNTLILGMAVGWTAIITYYSLANSTGITSMPLNFDKLGHIAFYFGTTITWFSYFNSRTSNEDSGKALRYAFLFSFFYGILIEIFQGMFTETRQADLMDVLANTFGAVLAVALVVLMKRFSKSKK